MSDGFRKIVNINVKQQIVPKESVESSGDLGVKALLSCIVFLMVGLVVTTSMKMYRSIVKKKGKMEGQV